MGLQRTISRLARSTKWSQNWPSSAHSMVSLTDGNSFKSDVLIVGGGIMGSSTAFWVKRSSPSAKVTVIEKDPQYSVSSTPRSVGGIRSHFSLRENIQLSMSSFEFLTRVNEYLNTDQADVIDIGLRRKGYLYLATQKGAQVLLDNHEVQKSCGASIELLTPEQLKNRWPWLNVNDISLGSYGFDKEGSFDPYRLLMAFKAKAQSLGVEYVHGCVTDFICSSPESSECYLDGVHVELIGKNSSVIYSGDKIVIAGGSESGSLSSKLASLHKLGNLCPVNKRKRFVYSFKCDTLDGQQFPMLIDPSGTYCRGEGNNFITGLSPLEKEEPETNDLEVDYDFFDTHIWPRLAERVKPFESIKLLSAWAGFYDFCELDENAIIGSDPLWANVYWVTGFSGHGIQMGPSVGKCMSELLLEGQYKTVDCSRFSFNRVVEGSKLTETNII